MTQQILKKERVAQFIAELEKSHIVYGPVKSDSLVSFVANPGDKLRLDIQTTDRSPKDIFFPQTEVLLTYSGGKTEEPAHSDKPVAIFGTRPCDARAFSLLDKVFLGEPYTDPYWQARRNGALVFSIGCNRPSSTCFCHWTGGGPFDQQGSDVLLTDIGPAFVMTACTDRGEEILTNSKILNEAGPDEISAAEKLKHDAPAQLTETVDVTQVGGTLEKMWEDEFWEVFSAKCLGCAACAYLCPTCHCFDVQDEGQADCGRRIRIWDSCSFDLFTKEASGHNPRPSRKERLRQRIMHKFSYFPGKFGTVACVGCGRCVRACPANIDLRTILETTVKKGPE